MAQHRMTRRTMGIATVFGVALLGAGVVSVSNAFQATTIARGNPPGEWRYWGADAWSSRYSTADQINASNFDSLAVAWTRSFGVLGDDEYWRATPLYANGRLFTVTSTRRVATAIDPEDGDILWLWRLNEGIQWQKAPRQFAGRGLAYWTDGRGNERIILLTPGYHMASLDAKTGVPDPKFGKDGVVDLMQGLNLPIVPLAVDDSVSLTFSDLRPMRKARPGETWDPVTKTGADGTVGIDPALGQIAISSPAIVVNDVVIVGSSHIHGYYPVKVRNLPGYIRGFDIKTGKQLWLFNLIPQPGEFGADTWKNGSKIGTEGVGKNDAWAPYAADPELGLVYIPVGMPLMDEYGGHRPGDNLFGNSVVAIDVKTGKRKWHFQMVHHDIWDYDTPMSPNLLDVTVNGQRRKVLAQTTKQGFVYVFDRATGEPIWPIVERPVLQSEVPGEQTSPTQPIPTKPLPFAQQGLVEADLIDYTPAIKDSALKIAQRCRMGPYYIPAGSPDPAPSGKNCGWYAPGASGGVNIDGGAAADPETGLLYVGGQSPDPSAMDVRKDPCSEFRYSSPHDACGIPGALPPPPGYVGRGGGRAAGGGGGGRAAGGDTTGRGAAAAGAAAAGAARGGGGGGAGGGAAAAGGGGGGRAGGGGGGRGGLSIGGVSIIKPKQFGGITAYDLNTGDKAWWISNSDSMRAVTTTDPLFTGINLPPVPVGRGMAQVITTKTLVIYGQGRSGGAGDPRLFAVDKATGKKVGAFPIAAKTSAVPMTFMHKGQQYIVFASGGGANPTLTALKLSRFTGGGGGRGRGRGGAPPTP